MTTAEYDLKLRSIEAWLEDPKNLPPMPAVVDQALSLLDNQASGAADIARLISRDEVVTAKILKIVNSAFYGLPRRINTISYAIALLGLQQVRLLLLGVTIFESGKIRDPRIAQYRETIWQHSLATAEVAQILAKKVGYEPVEEAFIAGLLHDVGKVVLAVYSPDQFGEAMALSQRDGLAFFEAEEATIGVDHMDAGVLICKQWNLPAIYQEVIRLHHVPCPSLNATDDAQQARARKLLAILQVSNTADMHPAQEPQATDDDADDSEAVEENVQTAIQQLLAQVEAILNGTPPTT